MIDDQEEIQYEEDEPKVFKLITGEEIITTVARVTDHYFMIEVPLEIRYNSIKQSLFLTKWMFGSDYSKVMTLSGSSIVSVSSAEGIVVENYFEYRRQMTEEMIEEAEEEHKEMHTDLDEEDVPPTFH
tara:strand:- start:2628 stop:3011 length:384 start_codon:yes stop_codon:yes gene_type:complete